MGRRFRCLPTTFPLLHQGFDQFGIGRILGHVGVLLRINLVIVKLDRIHLRMIIAVDPHGEAVAIGAHAVAHQGLSVGLARILTEGRGLPRELGVVHQRLQAHALQVVRQRHAGEIAERGIDVDELGQGRTGLAGGLLARRGNNERRIDVVLHIRVLTPQAVLAEVPTVVTPKDDDGILVEPEGFQLRHDAADLCVGVADGGVVSMAQLACEVVGHVSGGRNTAVIADLAVVHINRVFGRVLGHKSVGGQLDFRGIIHVPVFFRRDEGQVRFDETDREEERLVLLGQFLQRLNGQVGHLAVLVGVVGNVGAFVGRPAGIHFGFIAFAFCHHFSRGRLGGFFNRERLGQHILGRFGRLKRHRPTRLVVQLAMVNFSHALYEIPAVLEGLP